MAAAVGAGTGFVPYYNPELTGTWSNLGSGPPQSTKVNRLRPGAIGSVVATKDVSQLISPGGIPSAPVSPYSWGKINRFPGGYSAYAIPPGSGIDNGLPIDPSTQENLDYLMAYALQDPGGGDGSTGGWTPPSSAVSEPSVDPGYGRPGHQGSLEQRQAEAQKHQEFVDFWNNKGSASRSRIPGFYDGVARSLGGGSFGHGAGVDYNGENRPSRSPPIPPVVTPPTVPGTGPGTGLGFVVPARSPLFNPALFKQHVRAA